MKKLSEIFFSTSFSISEDFCQICSIGVKVMVTSRFLRSIRSLHGYWFSEVAGKYAKCIIIALLFFSPQVFFSSLNTVD